MKGGKERKKEKRRRRVTEMRDLGAGGAKQTQAALVEEVNQ